MNFKKPFTTIATAILASTAAVVLPFTVFGYELNDADVAILDTLEQRIFEVIESNDAITPEVVVTAIETLASKKDLNDRAATLISTLIENIEQGIGEDEGEYDDYDDYEGEYDDYEDEGEYDDYDDYEGEYDDYEDEGEYDDYDDYEGEYDDYENEGEYDDYDDYEGEYDDYENEGEYDDYENEGEYDDYENEEEYDDYENEGEYDDYEDEDYDDYENEREYDYYNDYEDYEGEYNDYDGDYDTLLPEDCFEDEYYDAQEQRCYPVDGSNNGLSEGEDWDDFGDFEHGHFEERGEDQSVEAAYGIQSDDSITLTDGAENTQHQEVWNLFTSLIAPSYRQDLLKLTFIREPQDDTLAYVEQIQDNEQYREMGINLSMFYPDGKTLDKKESIHTLIHEYTHVLTLNKDQVTYTPLSVESESEIKTYESQCSTHYLQEGCLKEDAYLKSYIDLFWTASEREEANEGYGIEYVPSKFVSDYAASNPGEDIAETFTHFVLKSKPTGTSVKDKKVLFFYDFPELVKFRDLVRSRLPN